MTSTKRASTTVWMATFGLMALLIVHNLSAADPPAKDPAPAAENAQPPANGDTPAKEQSQSKDPPGMTRLMKGYDVWIDKAHKRVVVDGTVCLREGQLEMFACLRGTKEHESIIAADAKAYAVHAGLLAVGAKSGTPVQYQPTYKAATGQEIDIQLIWTDKNGTVHRDKAQDWVKNAKTGKPLEYDWLFAGSGFWQDENTGEKAYLAESGDFICVSNFPSAMLDLPVESSQSDQALLYQAFTDHIPPVGTRVRMVLTPKVKK